MVWSLASNRGLYFWFKFLRFSSFYAVPFRAIHHASGDGVLGWGHTFTEGMYPRMT